MEQQLVFLLVSGAYLGFGITHTWKAVEDAFVRHQEGSNRISDGFAPLARASAHVLMSIIWPGPIFLAATSAWRSKRNQRKCRKMASKFADMLADPPFGVSIDHKELLRGIEKFVDCEREDIARRRGERIL